MPYLTIRRLERIPWLIHGFGTASWRESDFRKVEAWRDFKLVVLDQVHSDVIHRIERPPRKKLSGDGLISRRPHLFLVIKTADCLPALAVDESRGVIAAVHCGWRGTKKRILEKMVLDLKEFYGCDPSKLIVALGPCIGPECYEVGDEVVKEFGESGFPAGLFVKRRSRPGRSFLDLRAANLWLLGQAGVKRKNIFSLGVCTHCSPELLSFRRDQEKTRRMFAFIGKKSWSR